MFISQPVLASQFTRDFTAHIRKWLESSVLLMMFGVFSLLSLFWDTGHKSLSLGTDDTFQAVDYVFLVD